MFSFKLVGVFAFLWIGFFAYITSCTSGSNFAVVNGLLSKKNTTGMLLLNWGTHVGLTVFTTLVLLSTISIVVGVYFISVYLITVVKNIHYAEFLDDTINSVPEKKSSKHIDASHIDTKDNISFEE